MVWYGTVAMVFFSKGKADVRVSGTAPLVLALGQKRPNMPKSTHDTLINVTRQKLQNVRKDLKKVQTFFSSKVSHFDLLSYKTAATCEEDIKKVQTLFLF